MTKDEAREVVRKARTLLAGVPADKWISGFFTNSVSVCCVIGHFTRLTSEDPEDYSQGNCEDHDVPPERNLRHAFEALTRGKGVVHDLATLNNVAPYETRKEIVLRALDRALETSGAPEGEEVNR
jgi:hypothetical protein